MRMRGRTVLRYFGAISNQLAQGPSRMAEKNSYLVGNMIDGKAVAAAIRSEIAETVKYLDTKYGKVGVAISSLPHMQQLGSHTAAGGRDGN
jgi:hypothetical protein